MSRLITPSLFGSINWFNVCPDSWKEKAYKDLYNMLARIWTEPNEAVQRGMLFEKVVYNTLKGAKKISEIKCSEKFKKLLNICKGGQFQIKVKSFLDVDGIEYCLYGKIDVFFPEKIIDIKTTGKEIDKKKYLNSMQHILYCWITQIKDFEYWIVLFKDLTNEMIDIVNINYHVDNFDYLKSKIETEIRNMIQFISHHEELKKLYENTYTQF